MARHQDQCFSGSIVRERKKASRNPIQRLVLPLCLALLVATVVFQIHPAGVVHAAPTASPPLFPFRGWTALRILSEPSQKENQPEAMFIASIRPNAAVASVNYTIIWVSDNVSGIVTGTIAGNGTAPIIIRTPPQKIGFLVTAATFTGDVYLEDPDALVAHIVPTPALIHIPILL